MALLARTSVAKRRLLFVYDVLAAHASQHSRICASRGFRIHPLGPSAHRVQRSLLPPLPVLDGYSVSDSPLIEKFVYLRTHVRTHIPEVRTRRQQTKTTCGTHSTGEPLPSKRSHISAPPPPARRTRVDRQNHIRTARAEQAPRPTKHAQTPLPHMAGATNGQGEAPGDQERHVRANPKPHAEIMARRCCRRFCWCHCRHRRGCCCWCVNSPQQFTIDVRQRACMYVYMYAYAQH